MEPVLVLIAVVILAIPFSIVALFVSQSRLKHRVAELEARLAGADSPSPSAEKQPVEESKRPALWPKPEAAEDKDKDQNLSPAARVVAARRAGDEGDAQTGAEAPPNPDADTSPPKAVVFRADQLSALMEWLRENWFYAVSALSLALAGVFLVQYGVENGLLPPTARVGAALAFGAVLIMAGEVIRRRFGDGEDSATAYLPSVFSGAGLVTLFGGVLSARLLYDLIGPEAALIALVAVAVLGLVLGWFHGPLLAAIGLIGAYASPFAVGGSSEDPSWLYGYFALVAVLGLGIDTVRRWAWISVLALAGTYAAGWLLLLGESTVAPSFAIYAAAIAVAAILIPGRRIVPAHSGALITGMMRRSKGDPWPEFPTRLAFGALAISVFGIATLWPQSSAEFWLETFLLAGLTIALIWWAGSAVALQDVAALPALGLLYFVFAQGAGYGVVYAEFGRTYEETVEADYPFVVTILVALAALISVLAAWRSQDKTAYSAIWAAAAALFAPTMAILIEIGWQPADTLGAYPWALHAAALAALMVAMAERFARSDETDRLRMSFAVLSALSCLAFAFVIILSAAALTVALAVTVLVAAALDRQYKLPPMSAFITVGIVTLGFRLVVYPGIDAGLRYSLPDFVLAYGGTLAALLGALWLLRGLDRPAAKLILESACWSTGGLMLSLMLRRWLEAVGGSVEGSHWALGLDAVIWLGLAFAQVQRLELGGRLAKVRAGLAGLFGLIGLTALFFALGEANPLITAWASPVIGPPFVNTLLVAYLLPATVLALAVWRLPSMPRLVRQASMALSLGLAGLWLGLAIRHAWQGAGGMHESNGVTQPELYTYTVVLLIIGAVLFYQSLARRSDLMRKAGLVVIGLAVAKVFLIDIAGLGGLIRVFSLLALGLALACLAWLNRWATLRHQRESSSPLDQ